MRRYVLPLLALTLAPTATAHATSTVSLAGGVLTVQSDPGTSEAALRVNGQTSSTSGIFRVNGNGAAVTALTANCTQEAVDRVTCPKPSVGSIVVNAGDLDDNVAVLNAVASPYTINGGSGNDTIAGDNSDGSSGTLNGGDGDDAITGGFAQDTLIGGRGGDTLNGGQLADTIRYDLDVGRTAGVSVSPDGVRNDGDQSAAQYDGPLGDNVQAPAEVVYLTAGDDSYSGSNDTELVYGLGGADSLSTNGGADTVNGGAGADAIDGGNQDDVIDGQEGPDVLRGGQGNDVLRGGTVDASTDRLIGGAGADSLDSEGGVSIADPGIDRADYSQDGRTTGVTITLDGTPGDGDATFDAGGDAVGINVDSVTGTPFADTIRADYANNPTANTFSGQAGDDTLKGGLGTDFYSGGLGNDDFVGNQGADKVTYTNNAGYPTSTGIKVILNELPDDGVLGTELDNIHNDIEWIYGSEGPDLIDLSGYSGDQAGVTILGNGANDVLTGSAGDDLITGGDGSDTIFCQGGVDTAFGEMRQDCEQGADAG